MKKPVRKHCRARQKRPGNPSFTFAGERSQKRMPSRWRWCRPVIRSTPNPLTTSSGRFSSWAITVSKEPPASVITSPVVTLQHHTAPLGGSALGDSEHEKKTRPGHGGSLAGETHFPWGTADTRPTSELHPRSRAAQPGGLITKRVGGVKDFSLQILGRQTAAKTCGNH